MTKKDYRAIGRSGDANKAESIIGEIYTHPARLAAFLDGAYEAAREDKPGALLAALHDIDTEDNTLAFLSGKPETERREVLKTVLNTERTDTLEDLRKSSEDLLRSHAQWELPLPPPPSKAAREMLVNVANGILSGRLSRPTTARPLATAWLSGPAIHDFGRGREEIDTDLRRLTTQTAESFRVHDFTDSFPVRDWTEYVVPHVESGFRTASANVRSRRDLRDGDVILTDNGKGGKTAQMIFDVRNPGMGKPFKLNAVVCRPAEGIGHDPSEVPGDIPPPPSTKRMMR